MKLADAGPSMATSGGASMGHSVAFDTYVDADETGNFVIIPPDGGWGWVIVAAAFLCNVISDGITYSFGLFMTEIADDLKCSMTDVANTVSVLTATYYLTGPPVCAMTNRFGFRRVCMTGAVIAVGSFVATAYAPNVYMVIIVMGFLGGVALSMIYVTSIIIVGFYFERWRAMATAISVTGSAVGVIIVPQIIGLFENYTWRDQFLYLSVGFVIIFLCGATYKSLEPVEILADKDTSRTRGVDQTSVVSEGTERFTIGTGKGNRFHNKMFPTAAEVHGSTSFIISQVTSAPSVRSSKSKYKSKKNSVLSTVSKPVRTFNLEGSFIPGVPVAKTSKVRRCCPCCGRVKYPMGVNETASRLTSTTIKSRSKGVVPTRPLYRDDIFYQGSITGLSQLHKQSAYLMGPAYDYHMSVTRMATAADIEEQQSGRWICCPQSVKRILVTMCDINLLKQPSFSLLMISGFFTCAGVYVPYIYIVDMNIHNGVHVDKARFLLSVIGFSNAVGRVGCGLISLTSKIKPIAFTAICSIACGVSVLMLPFFTDLPMQYVCVCIFGLTNSATAVLRSIIIVDLYGLENLTNAFGIASLFQGVASCIGLPVSGVLKEQTGSYLYVMLFAGGTIVISGILILPVQVMNDWERKKALKKQGGLKSGATNKQGKSAGTPKK